MSSPAIATVIQLMESLPEDIQDRYYQSCKSTNQKTKQHIE
ncbi:MAG TPA: hypothetical protein VK203_18210 [Nostocaceae cyanobacterium]|nr:hypothetical protein [Nostocaceae cyanobacterium]